MRQIVLDTETTGLDPQQGHRIIEVGAVEIERRRLTGRHFHHYVKPDREVEEAAREVHGISDAFLADKPPFEVIVDDFLAFVEGAELLIHNAPFDVGFIDSELDRLGSRYGKLQDYCRVTDTLAMARRKHPGQRNSLDALCKRYGVDNSQRELHGALLDAEILADVYLLLSGGQTDLKLATDDDSARQSGSVAVPRQIQREGLVLQVIQASEAEQRAHQALLDRINKHSRKGCLWLQHEPNASDTAASQAH